MWFFNSTLTYMMIGYLYGDGELTNDFTVETNYGTLMGTRSAMSRNGRNYYEFLGISYARPPLGELRFEPPLPPQRWDGIRNATSRGNRCLQIRLITNTRLGDEDCLNLNVVTHQIQKRRDLKPLEKLNPVVYYIHGGFFMGGAADVFDAKYFMDNDIVFVSANYRVASLGFLSTGDGEVPGNMGLKDQVMVLRWIQENIQYFGGDPKQVTIMGESAGAVAAHYHMLSPLSRGLFHQAISQSGNALTPWAFNSNPEKQALHFAEKLNCSRNSTKEMVKCLKLVDANKLISVHLDTMHRLEHKDSLFRPSIERISNDWTFLNDTPINIIQNRGSANVPWIVGINSDEGLLFSAAVTRNETRRAMLSSNWTTWAPLIFGFENEIFKDDISNRLWDFYFGVETAELTEDSWQNMTRLLSDYNFFNSVHQIANLSQTGVIQSPVYLYYFSYHAQFSLGKVAFGMTGNLPIVADLVVTTGFRWFSTNVLGMPEKHYGAAHADEVFLMFQMPFQAEHKNGTKDYQMSVDIIGLWNSFIRDGKPVDLYTHWEKVQSNGVDTISGKVYNNGSVKYMRLDKKMELIEEPFQDRAYFWESLNLN